MRAPPSCSASKRQGAYGVELRPGKVRFFFSSASPSAEHTRAAEQRPAQAGRAAPTRRRDAGTKDAAAPPATVSKRKLRSEARLRLFQRRVEVRQLWRRALRKVLKVCRHQRMWSVHNAWSAPLPPPAEPAGPPASGHAEAMDVVDDSASRASAPAVQQPGPRAEGGLRAEASEFAPGLPMAEVVSAWNAAVELAAGRWKVSWTDLAATLTTRADDELNRGSEAGDGYRWQLTWVTDRDRPAPRPQACAASSGAMRGYEEDYLSSDDLDLSEG